MIELLKIAGWIILGICLLNYGIDGLFFLKDRYCRYHIGRWERRAWCDAVRKTAVRWLKKTPTVKITDNNRYILLDIINGKYRSATIQSWQKAALILGLLGSAEPEEIHIAEESVDSMFDSSGMWKKKPVRVDCGMLSYAALSRVSGRNKIKPAMDYSVGIIKKYVNEEGLISYTGGNSSTELYVDTIGLAVPFLVAYANCYDSPECEELGFKQLKDFHDRGLLGGTNLPNHAYDCSTGLPLGVFGWGRGAGWYVIGLVDSLDLFADSQHRESVKNWIIDAAKEYGAYQRADGGFGSIIQSKNTYDSSATAVMAYFYAKAANVFHSEEYYDIADRCLNKLMACTRISGAVDWCQGDTKALGVFSQTYDIMPFAQGMAVRALNEMRMKQ